MAPVKRTFEQADEGWTNEQALASDLGHAVGDEQFPSGASHLPSQQISTDVAEGPAVQQAVQSAPPAKRPRKARRKRSDPPPDYSAAVQRNMSGLSRAAQACDRCKYRKVPCDRGYPAYRVTGRPIARGYLERVESYAYQNYQRSRHLQDLLTNTWSYANALDAHVRQLSHIVTQSGLPHPSPQIPENLWRAIHESNPGAAFAQLDPPPTPPPFGRTPGFPSQGNVPPTAQIPVAGPGPAMVNQPPQPQYPGTSSQPPGAVAQSARRAVKSRPDPRRDHFQRPNAGHPAMGAPSRVPPVPSVNVNTAYSNVEVHGVPRPQNPTTCPPTTRPPTTRQSTTHPPTVQHSVLGTSPNHGVALAHASYNAAGIPNPGATNRAGQQSARSTHIGTIDLTGDDGDYHPQGLGDGYPAPPGQYIATDIHQGPSGQARFPPPHQYPNDTIDPSVLMPAWSLYGLDDFDTGVQDGTESTAPFLESEQHHVPVNSDTGAQGSADPPAPAAEAATVDNGEHPGDSQPLNKVPSSPPLDFSVLDDKKLDDLLIPYEPLDLEPSADLKPFLAQLQGADANPVQSPQPSTSIPASVPASVHVVVPAAVDPYIPASVFPSSEPDSIDRELAEFLAGEPAVAEPQALFDLPSGSPNPESAHADDADSLFEGSLGISPSSAGSETAPTNEATARSRKTYNLGDFRFGS
ncbi:hypothetical protein ATEIFO6365_0013008000 [Aspergillus terreus]|uniref:Uncharacterized protein n=1 Tax=Aspergillus terreus TaxID=33178 RepID=A0A5M3ZFX2_ASPTE|nr:hypothetical protein ATETN484_0014008000 [Aspergillus terreus]GFF20746.1 hypothetical protein ATEIFO6365_0013008000 [Aspergillus terreus]